MASDLQLLVDRLSVQLGSATVLEDHEQRTVVYSRQAGPIDSVRRDSILHRATSPEVMAWFRNFGILEARGPLRIPAYPEMGILARICAPAWYRDRLLGFLWLIDDGRAGDGEVSEIARAAEHAALVLYEERLSQRLVVQALAHLLSPSEALRDAAAAQLVDQALLRNDEPTAVVVVQPLPPNNDVSATVVEEALLDVGWEAPTGSLLRLAGPGHGILLVKLASVDDDALAVSMAATARDSLGRRLGERPGPPARPGPRPGPVPHAVAAVGDPQRDILRAVSSYRQARLAAKVASAIPNLGTVVRWRDLGAFRALAQLPNREALESSVDPRVAALLRSGDNAVVSTLETYLDLGGDAKATAEQLHLHRGTLYYRLDKAQRISGIDVRNGYDRLAVHLGLKLARLAGPNGERAPGAGLVPLPSGPAAPIYAHEAAGGDERVSQLPLVADAS
ncbi:MAG: PucR family transcriptional regulator [Acidimicrobiales bacterium]